jgi:hypothetical protein
LEFRNRLIEFFPEVFADGEEGGSGDEIRLTKKWGWFGMVYRLANRNFLNLDDVYTKPIQTALMWTAYESDIAKMEQKAIRKK